MLNVLTKKMANVPIVAFFHLLPWGSPASHNLTHKWRPQALGQGALVNKVWTFSNTYTYLLHIPHKIRCTTYTNTQRPLCLKTALVRFRARKRKVSGVLWPKSGSPFLIQLPATWTIAMLTLTSCQGQGLLLRQPPSGLQPFSPPNSLLQSTKTPFRKSRQIYIHLI